VEKEGGSGERASSCRAACGSACRASRMPLRAIRGSALGLVLDSMKPSMGQANVEWRGVGERGVAPRPGEGSTQCALGRGHRRRRSGTRKPRHPPPQPRRDQGRWVPGESNAPSPSPRGSVRQLALFFCAGWSVALLSTAAIDWGQCGPVSWPWPFSGCGAPGSPPRLLSFLLLLFLSYPEQIEPGHRPISRS
jgi:hypothetical protein